MNKRDFKRAIVLVRQKSPRLTRGQRKLLINTFAEYFEEDVRFDRQKFISSIDPHYSESEVLVSIPETELSAN